MRSIFIELHLRIPESLGGSLHGKGQTNNLASYGSISYRLSTDKTVVQGSECYCADDE